MMKNNDLFWEELGVTWSAVSLDVRIMAPRLEVRLRRQSHLITACLVIGLPVCAAGMILAAFTVWSGWTSGALHFVTRGIAIGGISAVLASAMSLLLPVRAMDNTRALPEMIDLAINRKRRVLAMTRASLYACAIAAVFGLAGTAIRTRLSGPPRLSPFADLAVLAILALLLFIYSRQVRRHLGMYGAMKRALVVKGEP